MINQIIAGKYNVVEKLGQGSMGHIWKAFDENLRRFVAVKVMSSTLGSSPTAQLRFDREARAIAKLQSPHVVQVFDAGFDKGVPFIVMELLEGEDLHERLQRTGTMSVSATTKLIDEIARALAAAHTREIVHRDLKPANIFIAKDDSSRETYKILDFGVVAMVDDASDEHQRATAAGAMIGTPLYMSPEQIRSSYIDHRADLWSLGVLVYRALTGVVPFKGATTGALMVMICMDAFTPASTLVPSLPSGIDEFFQKALAKDPAKRFQSATEFAAAWNSLLAREKQHTAKILVVDDEPQVEKLFTMRFRRQLRQGVYEFVFAADGEQALRALREQSDIDVVFTDINMPKMDGLTFLTHLGEANPFARAVVMSAYGDMQNIRTAMNRGAFDFLTKPIDFDDLEVTATKTLRLTSELRKGARNSEVYGELRKFVSPALLRRVEERNPLGIIEQTEGTVAFIGISGQDARLMGSQDDYLRALNANFEIIVPLVARRGGVIHQFIGGTAMIVFQGEDHLSRTIEACIDVRDNLQGMALRAGAASPFAMGVSIGIASGNLLIGEVGSNAYERLDLTVLGEAQLVAIRLQISARKNQLLVDGNTRQSLEGRFELLPIELPNVQALEILERTNARKEPPIVTGEDTMHVSQANDMTTGMGESGVRSSGHDAGARTSVDSSG